MSGPDSRGDASAAALIALMQLGQRARQADSADVLGFVAVNETRQLLDYRQSAVWLRDKGVAALSGLAAPEPNTPYGQWLQQACRHWLAAAADGPCDLSSLPEGLAAEWSQWLPEEALVLPLRGHGGDAFGLWLLAREHAWEEAETAAARELAGIYGHAWGHFLPRQNWREKLAKLLGDRRRRLRIGLAALAVILFPVRLTVLAPAEVIAQDPFPVRVPLEGVVDRFHVRPNEPVKAGQALFDLDTTGLQTRLGVARKAYEAASEEYRQAAQLAVTDDEKSRLELAARKGRMEEKATELAYSEQLLDRVLVKSPREGVTVFADSNDWIGKAVAMGERVMQIADPQKVEIGIRLPVADAIELESDARVTLYLTTAPQYSYSGRLSYAAYKAEPTPEGMVAYRLKARFDADERPPRLGLTGTAKLYGQWVPLAYYVLRRPLAAARQRLGW